MSLLHASQSPDEEMKKIVLKVVKQCGSHSLFQFFVSAFHSSKILMFSLKLDVRVFAAA
jgi:hypothetical protein